MKIVTSFVRIALPIILIAILPSCAAFRGSSGGGGEVTVAALPVERTEAEYLTLLRDTVRDEISATSGRAKARIVSHKPYFYKTYAEYPGGEDSFDIDMRDSDSRMAPMSADVTMIKRRFSTPLSRDREEARLDEGYLRDTGEETVSLEFRNGHWRRMGSIFVADETEELINGEWVPVQKTFPAPLGAPSGEAGWFGRTMNKLQFWR